MHKAVELHITYTFLTSELDGGNGKPQATAPSLPEHYQPFPEKKK